MPRHTPTTEPGRKRRRTRTSPAAISIRVPDETREKLEIIAAEQDLTISQLVRRAVTAALHGVNQNAL